MFTAPDPKSPLFDMVAGIVNAQAALVRGAAGGTSNLNPRLTRRIVTQHVHPPIPVRHMDWQATFEGYEPGDSVGTGATEREAIDWLIAEEAWAIAHEHKKEPA